MEQTLRYSKVQGRGCSKKCFKNNEEITLEKLHNARHPKNLCKKQEGLNKQEIVYYLENHLPISEKVLGKITKKDTSGKLRKRLEYAMLSYEINAFDKVNSGEWSYYGIDRDPAKTKNILSSRPCAKVLREISKDLGKIATAEMKDQSAPDLRILTQNMHCRPRNAIASYFAGAKCDESFQNAQPARCRLMIESLKNINESGKEAIIDVVMYQELSDSLSQDIIHNGMIEIGYEGVHPKNIYPINETCIVGASIGATVGAVCVGPVGAPVGGGIGQALGKYAKRNVYTSSGLAIYVHKKSKFMFPRKKKQQEFKYFTSTYGADAVGYKGILGTKIVHKRKKNFETFLFVAHPSPYVDPKSSVMSFLQTTDPGTAHEKGSNWEQGAYDPRQVAAIHMQQLENCKDFMKDFVFRYRSKKIDSIRGGVFIGGDMNINMYQSYPGGKEELYHNTGTVMFSQEYHNMLQRLGAYPPLVIPDVVKSRHLSRQPYVSFDGKDPTVSQVTTKLPPGFGMLTWDAFNNTLATDSFWDEMIQWIDYILPVYKLGKADIKFPYYVDNRAVSLRAKTPFPELGLQWSESCRKEFQKKKNDYSKECKEAGVDDKEQENDEYFCSNKTSRGFLACKNKEKAEIHLREVDENTKKNRTSSIDTYYDRNTDPEFKNQQTYRYVANEYEKNPNNFSGRLLNTVSDHYGVLCNVHFSKPKHLDLVQKVHQKMWSSRHARPHAIMDSRIGSKMLQMGLGISRQAVEAAIWKNQFLSYTPVEDELDYSFTASDNTQRILQKLRQSEKDRYKPVDSDQNLEPGKLVFDTVQKKFISSQTTQPIARDILKNYQVALSNVGENLDAEISNVGKKLDAEITNVGENLDAELCAKPENIFMAKLCRMMRCVFINASDKEIACHFSNTDDVLLSMDKFNQIFLDAEKKNANFSKKKKRDVVKSSSNGIFQEVSCVRSKATDMPCVFLYTGRNAEKGRRRDFGGGKGETLYIVFRMTDGRKNWFSNFNLREKRGFHKGFYQMQADLQSSLLTETTRYLKKYPSIKSIKVTGMSLGGAMAIMLGLALITSSYRPLPEKSIREMTHVVTFGAPPVMTHNRFRKKYSSDKTQKHIFAKTKWTLFAKENDPAIRDVPHYVHCARLTFVPKNDFKLYGVSHCEYLGVVFDNTICKYYVGVDNKATKPQKDNEKLSENNGSCIIA